MNLPCFISDASEMRVDEMKNILKAAKKQAKGMLQKFEDKCKKAEVHLNMILRVSNTAKIHFSYFRCIKDQNRIHKT